MNNIAASSECVDESIDKKALFFALAITFCIVAFAGYAGYVSVLSKRVVSIFNAGEVKNVRYVNGGLFSVDQTEITTNIGIYLVNGIWSLPFGESIHLEKRRSGLEVVCNKDECHNIIGSLPSSLKWELK